MNCVICNTEMKAEEKVMCAKEDIRLFEEPHTIQYQVVQLYRCPCCTHMQIENVISDDIYEKEYNVDYASWASVQQSDRAYLKKISSLSQGTCVCEIGCGEGRTLALATEFFESVIGVEPATKQAILARERIGKKGVVKNEFFSNETNLETVVDAFYSKMVFEHLDNPCVVLKRMYDCLKPGGVGWLNVPNGQRIFNQNLYHLFSAVHLQYYTPFSLSWMAHKAGFDLIEIDSHEDNSEIMDIDILIRKPDLDGGKFSEKKASLQEAIKSKIAANEIVTIWGAGVKSHKYIEVLDSEINVHHIIDKSDEKTNKYISRLNLPIEPVSDEIIKESDVIMIFASMYNVEIMNELKQMNYTGRVLYFKNGCLEVLEYE